MRNQLRIALAVAFMSVAGLGAVPGQTQAPAQPAALATDVIIDNFTFGPAKITVPVGTTVTWTNRDDIPHTVVSTDQTFKSKVLDTNDKFSFTFMKKGTFPYFCSIHPKMTGTVIVK